MEPITIYLIRNNTISANIYHGENTVTSYRASTAEPITMIHDTHVQMLQDKFNEITGQNLDRTQFIAALGLDDAREFPEEEPVV